MGTDYPEVTKTRLRHLLTRHLRPGIHSERAPVEVLASGSRDGEFRPIAPGDPWGSPWSTTWFRLRGTVPASWERAALLVDLGFQGGTGFTCEAMAWQGGQPWRGIDPNHRVLPVPPGPLDLLVEAAANPKASQGGGGRGPSMIEARESPVPAFLLGPVELAREEPEVRALYLDFKVLLGLALCLPAHDPRGAAALAACNRCANALQLDDLGGTAAAGRAELAPVLARHNGDGAHRVTAVGHAHIDTAWLWPLKETRRKVARTFATAVRLLDEYPEHRFAASQALHYAWLKEDHPELYERVRELVAAGRWEPVGGMWVEPDCNLPSGESLARQFLHGKRFFREEFGVDSDVAWLPDIFGYPASLPGIAAGAGCGRFMTQKLSWNQLNRMPHDSFWWEGLDGTRVLTHFPPADTYNGSFEVGELNRGVDRYRDHGRSERSLYLFGWGDGGGGPEPDMLEAARRLRDLDGAPRVELGGARDFFDALEADGPRLARWSGELFLEYHRGTFTTQARTKRLHRQAEQALRAAELWSAAAGEGYPRAELDRAWKTLLTCEFHDILPGSSIDWVYEDAERDLAAVISAGEELGGAAARKLLGEGGSPVVLNSAGHARREVLETEAGLHLVEVPACGWAPLPAASRGGGGAEADDGRLENDLLRVQWNAAGDLVSIFDKACRREVLAGPANVFQLHPDYPDAFDAWEIEPHYEEQLEDLGGLEDAAIAGSGGLRAAVRFRRRFRSSTLEQRMVLDAGSRVIRFETEVDWQEERRLLKVAFPVAVRSTRASYEIQFGHVERSTHRNTSWDAARFEVPALRWADLGEAGYGVALLNDCKHGHDVLGNVMRLSLLRGPRHPDPRADLGRHRFTYALLPHPGSFREAGVIQAAEALNTPLVVAAAAPDAGTRSFVQLDTPRAVISAVKRAEDSDALIVRLYEAWGGRGDARLRCGLPFRRAALTDLLEREIAELPVAGDEVPIELEPFKVVTVKLE